MNWIILVIAGLFEVGFTFSLGKAQSLPRKKAYGWYASFLVCTMVSMMLLMHVSKSLPIGSVYAVWAGIGAVGTVIVGIIAFKDSISFWRIFFITTLLISIIGLKLVSH